MADTRFSRFWHGNEDVLVTVRARLTGSMSGWHDFKHAEPFIGEGGFSIPDSNVVDVVSAPALPNPDPNWKMGDLVSAEYVNEHGEWVESDYFELVTLSSNVWKNVRDNRQVFRMEMRNVTPIARDGRPWTEDDS